RHLEHAVLQLRVRFARIDLDRERDGALEGAVANFPSVVVLPLLLALLACLTSDGEVVVGHREVKLVLFDSRHLQLDDDVAVRFGYFDGRPEHRFLSFTDGAAKELSKQFIERIVPAPQRAERLPRNQCHRTFLLLFVGSLGYAEPDDRRRRAAGPTLGKAMRHERASWRRLARPATATHPTCLPA